MSAESDNVLNSFELPSQAFDFQASEFAVVINQKATETSQKQVNKKRKAATAALSSTSAKSSQNAAYYLQLAVDNLLLAFAKEIDQSNQNKIQFVLAKTQHILLNNAGVEFDSQLDIQNQVKAIQADIAAKFQELQTSIADLQFVNLSAANQLTNQLTNAKSINQNSKSVNKSIKKPVNNSVNTVDTSDKFNAKTATAKAKTYAQIADKATDKNTAQNEQN